MTTTGNIAVNREFVEGELNFIKYIEMTTSAFLNANPAVENLTVDDGNDCFGMKFSDIVIQKRDEIKKRFEQQGKSAEVLRKALEDMLEKWDSVEEENKKTAEFYAFFRDYRMEEAGMGGES